MPGSALFGATATSTADGAANASYDSFTALGGGMLMAAMMLGEISPGEVGSGLYGLLMVALIAVFLGGLMPLPAVFLLTLFPIVVLYAVAAEVAKSVFYRREEREA